MAGYYPRIIILTTDGEELEELIISLVRTRPKPTRGGDNFGKDVMSMKESPSPLVVTFCGFLIKSAENCSTFMF